MKKVKGITLDGKIITGSNWKKVFGTVPDVIILPLSEKGKVVNIDDFDFNKFLKPIIKRKTNLLLDNIKY